ncbi:MAG: hypothetical protein H0V49_01510 [Nocardioidaceae bacterium]|nr:hypothetical protein [Nocardioidaceae bacterium]
MDETHWQRHLLVGLLALAVAAALLGGIGAMLTLRAAELTGIQPPTELASDNPAPSLRPRAPQATEAAGAQGTDRTPARTAPDRPIVLTATPQTSRAYGRVILTGTYDVKDATTWMRVQRFDGETWVDYGDGASVDGGRFSTYIRMGLIGATRFRVQDDSGQKSNAVEITIT